jgi:hypothetical protein
MDYLKLWFWLIFDDNALTMIYGPGHVVVPVLPRYQGIDIILIPLNLKEMFQ